MGQGNNCESCAYYLYDEDYECYVCDMDLDEDEMAHFMMGNVRISSCMMSIRLSGNRCSTSSVIPQADSVHACMKRWLLRDKLSART